MLGVVFKLGDPSGKPEVGQGDPFRWIGGAD